MSDSLRLRRSGVLAFVLVAAARPSGAQPAAVPPVAPRPGVGPLRASAARLDLAYRIAMPDPASHLYEIGLDVGAPAGAATALGDTLRLILPVWSPGRYARMDFARNVQDFQATDGTGKPLRWTKLGGSAWGVATRGVRNVRVQYRVFANNLSGTFSVLDTAHANWNGASLFMYVEGHKPDPVRLTVAAPPGWVVVNGAQGNAALEGSAPNEFRLPNYDLLVDTPTEVAPGPNVTVDSFTVDGRRYRVMVHHNGPRPAGAQERFVRQVRDIVARENQVVAPPPLSTYTFLFNIGYQGGDGMEHLYSTQIANPRAWTDTAAMLPGISTASHEYFHTWNMKRLRAAPLGPFDYTEAQHQPGLWVGEGWTQYYGDVTLHRAGVIDRAAFYRNLANTLQFTSEAPGRKERSARQASFDAPYFDGAAQPMQTNGSRTFLSYYPKGEVLALALDLIIRGETHGAKSLDDVLRVLKQRTWDGATTSYYLQGHGYTEADVERAASDVLGRDLHPWFDQYVGGVDDLPWDELLRAVGLLVERPAAGTPNGRWAVSEDAKATAEQVRLREAWLK
ncbi:MAG: M61 family metallopeptidase [Gemmatirosa sp.]|nr:M61 family metallopeptidase [Gemmatirosa sp.]